MILKANTDIGPFEVKDITYLPNDIKRQYDEEEMEIYDLLRGDDRFLVYQASTFGSSEVFIKEGTKVELYKIDRHPLGSLYLKIGDFEFYIPLVAYTEGDIIDPSFYEDWEDLTDSELRECGVEVVPNLSQEEIKAKRDNLLEKLKKLYD